MASPPRTRWSGFEGERRNVNMPVRAPSGTVITSATLSLGSDDIALTVSADPDGYKLAVSGLLMPSAGVHQWKAKVVETGMTEPLVVAVGDLHVKEM